MVAPDTRLVTMLWRMLEQRIAVQAKPVVLGICGAQGSGKSTLAAWLEADCRRRDIPAAVLSIDDLYLTRAEREHLARTVHPLLGTRGVPGTHDVRLGLDILAAIDRGETPALPRFDKARDDRFPPAQWGKAPAGCQVVILEGWCVGARPQHTSVLASPVNDLEKLEDAQGVWRRFVNEALAGEYQCLFQRLDLLLLLAAPCFDVVRDWRLQQEMDLRARTGAGASGLMDEAGIEQFIRHYQRLTQHILAEMPGRADMTVWLSEDRTVRRMDGW